MLKPRNVLDDLITLAVCREPDSDASAAGQAPFGAAGSSQAFADGGFETMPNALTGPFAPIGVWGSFATQFSAHGAQLALAAPDNAAGLIQGTASVAPFKDSSLAVVAAPRGDATQPAPSGQPATAPAPDSSAVMTQTDSAGSAEPGFSKAALLTTQPQQIDFTSGPLPAFGSDTNLNLSLPSFLFQQFSYGTSISFAGFGLKAGVSVSGGVKGTLALGLGEFTPNYPVTINPGVVPFVQDGQVFSIDPALISTNDAQFSLSLPQLNANLDFGLQANAGFTLSFPGIPIGVTLPFIGFVGYTIHIPSQFLGFQGGNIYKLASSTTIKIPGDGSVTLSELQAQTVQSGSQSTYEGLPTLEVSGNTAPFFVANTDLVSLLAEKEPDPFAVLAGSKSFDGIASLSYKLFSLELSGSLWLNEQMTLTPIGITETVTDTLTGMSQTGTLGQSFDFTAPTSGSGIIPFTISFGLVFEEHVSLELDGNVTVALEGPSVSASVLGISKTLGPLGNFNLLSISGELVQLYSYNSRPLTITNTATIDVQNFATAVTQTISGASGAVTLNKPATDLLVTAAGTVSGAAFGVKTGTLSAAMVTNYGLITASGNGVQLQEGGTVDVESGGRITAHGAGSGAGVLAMANPIDAVINEGVISGFAQGLMLSGGSVKNETGAVISATSLGVSIANTNAVIVNNGSISASRAVSLTYGGSLYNALDGVITGGVYGVYAGTHGVLSVENHCTLTGGGTAVLGLTSATVTNLAGAYIHGGAVGVILDGGDTGNELVSNGVGGTISGGKVGVSLYGANVTVADSGLISGSVAAVTLYGTLSNTLILDPNAQLAGAVRLSSTSSTISLTAGSGGVGTLAGIGGSIDLQGTIAIAAGAAWDVGGNFNGITLSGLNLSDRVNDTAVSYSAGERAVLNRYTDVISIHAAGDPVDTLGTIQLYGAVPAYGLTVTADASGGIDITFINQKISTVSVDSGEIDMEPAGIFAPDVRVEAGVTASANYYGANAQAYGAFAGQERATLTNYGTVLGNNTAVAFLSGGAVTNAAGALISGTVGVMLGSNSIDVTDTVSLTNAGVISAQSGAVYLGAAGTVTNTGQIISATFNGVQMDAVGTVFNQGTINGGRSAVRMFDGGFVYNETYATLAGHSLFGVEITGAYGKVVNCGAIYSTSGAGVSLGYGGLVVNEYGAITGATVGVQIAGGAGNIANAAYIKGVLLAGGGTIVNAATGTITAADGYGVSFYNAAGPVGAYLHNMGIIAGVLAFGDDVIVNDGIIDGVGVVAGSAGSVTVTNSGTIQGSGGVAVQFSSASDRLIADAGSHFIGVVEGGGGALELAGGTGTITGLGASGKLSGAEAMTFSGFGTYVIDTGGTWTLTGTNTLGASQTLVVAGALTNNGKITASAGIDLLAGGSIDNAAVADLISGTIGVYAGANGAATVTNFGTIQGTGGTAVQFGSAGDRLIVEAGSHFTGVVEGGGGALELAGGTGTITGLGGAGTLSGAEAMTFSGFGSYAIDAGGNWTLAGGHTLAANQTLTNAGTLTGTLALGAASDRLILGSGSVVKGAVTGGGGVLELAAGAGTITGLGATGTLSGASSMTFSGFGAYAIDAGGSWTLAGGHTLVANQTLTNTGTLTGALALGAASDRLIVASGAILNGAVTGGGGVLELAGGAGTIGGLGATGTLSGGASMTFSGFGSYAIDAAAAWTSIGANTLKASQTLAVAGLLTNTGTVSRTGGAAISLLAGGSVDNATTASLISGTVGVYAGASGAATVTNFGTIKGSGGVSVQFGSASDRLIAEAGSHFTGAVNGGGGTLELAAGTGTISGLGGVGKLSGAEAMTFSGFGSYAIDGGGTWTLTGVDTLGASQALVVAGSLINNGTITGTASAGVDLLSGGSVKNAAATRLISGTIGVYAGASGAATVTNFGTIKGTGGTAVQFGSAGDRLIAESGSTFVGSVQGGGGALELAGGTGTITGLGGAGTLSGAGAMTFSGFGSYAIDAGGNWTLAGANTLWVDQTLANAGTLSGNLALGADSDRLIAAAGSVVTGLVSAAGGVLEVAGGGGTISGLGATGTLSGGTAMTFSGFGTYQIDAGAWTLAGTNTLRATQVLSMAGALTNNGAIDGAATGVDLLAGGSLDNASAASLMSGSLGVYAGATGAATVTNFGTIQGTGGTAVQFGSAGDRLIAESGSTFVGVVVGGGGTLELGGGTGTITGLGGAGTLSGAEAMSFSGFGAYAIDTGGSWTLAGNDVLTPVETLGVAGTLTLAGTLTGAGAISGATGSKIILKKGDIVGGTLSSAGAVTISGTGNILDGTATALTSQATITVANKAALTIQGSIVNSGKIALGVTTATTSLIVTKANATLGGGGSVVLGASAFNTVTGGTATATLTNVDNKISGSGQIGAAQLILVNEAAGLIEQTGAVALTINTGTRSITNAGTIEATGAGGLTIAGAVANTGLLEAIKGALIVSGAVTGTGSAVINAATLTAASTFTENVTFSGITGELVLAKSQTYKGSITGFSTSGKTSLDLRDIGFVSASEATFSGTATGGTLTVTDGTHTAKIALVGNYTKSSWTASSDGASGVIVVDPTEPPMAPPSGNASPPAFISAMAGMTSAAGASKSPIPPDRREPIPMMAAARFQLT